MRLPSLGSIAISLAALAVLTFMLAPIVVIGLYAFSDEGVQVWPITRFSLSAFGEAWNNREIRAAFGLSLKVATVSTSLAVVIATLLAFVIHRFRFFGRDAASFVVMLPIALPGIITGIALNSYFAFAGIQLSITTLIIAHTTFCIVIIYTNVLARLKRMPASFIEASMDLGANGFRTFWHVTLPMIASAIASGALLAFALSFDEVIVTTFTAGVQTTLPLWIFGAIRLGQHLDQVNAVVLAVIVVTAVPVLISQTLLAKTDDS